MARPVAVLRDGGGVVACGRAGLQKPNRFAAAHRIVRISADPGMAAGVHQRFHEHAVGRMVLFVARVGTGRIGKGFRPK